VEVRLEVAEAQLLKQLCAELRERLLAVDDASAAGDVDPALGRLFPDGYRDDPAAAAELRSLIQSDLRDGKLAAVQSVVSTLDALPEGGKSRLDDEQAAAWLSTLNDLRLTLGTALDVTEDDDPRFGQDVAADLDDPDAFGVAVYLFLGWLQSHLVDALD
jgi:hypothetical protein